jgi:hypothetical protein
MPKKPRRNKQKRTRGINSQNRTISTLQVPQTRQPPPFVSTQSVGFKSQQSKNTATMDSKETNLKYFWPTVKLTGIIGGTCLILMIIIKIVLG